MRRSPYRSQVYAFMLLAALLAASCGDGRRPVFPVRGQVLYEGKPTPGAMVFFHPLNDPDPQAPRAIARVAADGSFSPTTYGGGDGAAEGEYAVTISWVPDLDQQTLPKEEQIKVKNQVPDRYSKAETSGFRVRIHKGPNELEPFRLTR